MDEGPILEVDWVTANRYKTRAGDFIRSAGFLSTNIHDGWLPSAGLLLGFACELLAKGRLIYSGVSENALRNAPYGHDISGMWRNETTLYTEAQNVTGRLKQTPNGNGVSTFFDWEIHFDQLAQGHSRAGDYSLRYHKGERHFADPKAMTIILSEIWLTFMEQ